MCSMRLPDLVTDTELTTSIEKECTIHVLDEFEGRKRVQLKQKWRRSKYLGRGAYGSVWLEECVDGEPHDAPLRAVKQIRKFGHGNKQIDYHRELEAIMKFSNRRVRLPLRSSIQRLFAFKHSLQLQYKNRFVRSSGWYQSPDHVYIAMEHCSLGDLSKHMEAPIQEHYACDIIFQILEGLWFMHSNGFAHRDLKPNVRSQALPCPMLTHC